MDLEVFFYQAWYQPGDHLQYQACLGSLVGYCRARVLWSRWRLGRYLSFVLTSEPALRRAFTNNF